MFGSKRKPHRRQSGIDREQLLLQTRETIGGLKVIIAGLRAHLDEIEDELQKAKGVE